MRKLKAFSKEKHAHGVIFAYKHIHELGPQATNHWLKVARNGCIIKQGSDMVKSISSVSEHVQECGECVGSDETCVRESKDQLQCFSQEMKVCRMVTANICF